MDKTIMIFSGRNFTSEDIDLIKWTRKRYPQLSRTELARTLCEFLGWTTPAGRGKTPQCTSFLEKLEEEGLIELPQLDASKRRLGNSKIPDFKIDTTPITGELKDLLPIHLEIARAGMELKLWRHYEVLDYAVKMEDIREKKRSGTLNKLELASRLGFRKNKVVVRGNYPASWAFLFKQVVYYRRTGFNEFLGYLTPISVLVGIAAGIIFVNKNGMGILQGFLTINGVIVYLLLLRGIQSPVGSELSFPYIYTLPGTFSRKL